MQGAEVDVTVVVVTWQGAHLLRDCLSSLAAQTLPHELIVVDNASTDGTRDLLAAEYPYARVIALARNMGFAGGIAAALVEVHTPYVALLNNDAAADPRWLERSVATLEENPDIAGVTAKLLLWDRDRLNNAGVVLTRDGYGADRGLDKPDGPPFDTATDVFGFSGGAAVLRTDAVQQAGGFPAEFFLYYEDTDLAWRLRLASWRIRYEPGTVVRHRHAATSDRDSPMFAYYNERNRLLMLLRCAPAAFALRQLAWFGLTTASLTARRMLGQRIPPDWVFRLRLRLHVLGAVLWMTPAALRKRAAIGRRATVSRSTIIAVWAGKT
jgi:GT2 family glycosyltransferase